MLAEPVAGWAGLLGGGADAVERTRNALTYQPRTQQGQEGMNALANALQSARTTMVDNNPPVNALVKALQATADYAGERSPALGAAVKTAPAALGLFAGPGGSVSRNALAEVVRPLAPAADNALEGYMRATGGLLDMAVKGPRQTVTIPASDEVFDALGIERRRVLADIDKLYRKHPDDFKDSADVERHLQYVFGGKPDEILPASDPRYTMLLRAIERTADDNALYKTATTDFTGERNGNYWVRSAFPMTQKQLEIKKSKK
jgi:hypothetical protein